MKKHQQSLKKLAKELQSKLAIDKIDDEIQLTQDHLEKLPTNVKELAHFAFVCLQSETGPLIGTFEKIQMEEKLKSFLIVSGIVQLDNRTSQILEIISIIFQHKTDLTSFENQHFINQLAEDFLTKFELISTQSYFQIFGSYQNKSSTQFNLKIAKILCELAKRIRLSPNFHNFMNLSVSMGNCLLILQNIAFSYGHCFDAILVNQYKNLMENLQCLPQNKRSYDILAARSIMSYLILTICHGHSQNTDLIKEVKARFERLKPKGHDIKVFLQIIRNLITKNQKMQEITNFLKIGIRFLRKYRQKVAKEQRNLEKKEETFYLTFVQYLEVHQNLLKSIKHPFSDEIAEVLAKNMLKELKEKSQESFFKLENHFTKEERVFLGIIMKSFYTKNGELREIIKVGVSKNNSIGQNDSPDLEH